MQTSDRAEQPSDVVGLTDPLVFLRGGCNNKTRAKTLYEIGDFINLVLPVLEEQVMSEQGQVRPVYRSAPRKPKLESVSVEEWCLANTRIMDILFIIYRLGGECVGELHPPHNENVSFF